MSEDVAVGATVRSEPQPAPDPLSPRAIADWKASEINAARGFSIDQAITGFDLLSWFGEFLDSIPDPEAWQPWAHLAEARRRAREHHRRTVVSSRLR